MLTTLAIWATISTFLMSGIIYNALRKNKDVNPWGIVACWLFPWVLIFLLADIAGTIINGFRKNED